MKVAILNYGMGNLGSVRRASRGSTCASANDNGRAAVRVLARWDVTYDRRTRHGITQAPRAEDGNQTPRR